jgi:hypothetical protein
MKQEVVRELEATLEALHVSPRLVPSVNTRYKRVQAMAQLTVIHAGGTNDPSYPPMGRAGGEDHPVVTYARMILQECDAVEAALGQDDVDARSRDMHDFEWLDLMNMAITIGMFVKYFSLCSV